MESNKNTSKKDWKTVLSSMNKNTLGILVCALILVLTLVIFFVTRGTTDSTETKKTEEEIHETMTVEDAKEIGDSDTSKVSTDGKDSGGSWKTMDDDEYSLQIDAVPEGYTGTFLEDGNDEDVKDIMALKFTNKGNQDVQYAEYAFSIGKEIVSFKLSDLPAGQSCLVLESAKHQNAVKEELSLVSRVVALVDEIPFARDEVLVVDNSDNTITIMNLTDKEIPVARAFYKSFDSEENMFVGGITYTAKAEKIPAGGGVTVAPTHYESGKSVIIGSGVYEKNT